MPLDPEQRKKIASFAAEHGANLPDTFIPDGRFHDLVNRLLEIVGDNDDVVDTALTQAVLDIAGVAPASWREFYERYGRK
jgi:hypothetical protein